MKFKNFYYAEMLPTLTIPSELHSHDLTHRTKQLVALGHFVAAIRLPLSQQTHSLADMVCGTLTEEFWQLCGRLEFLGVRVDDPCKFYTRVIDCAVKIR